MSGKMEDIHIAQVVAQVIGVGVASAHGSQHAGRPRHAPNQGISFDVSLVERAIRVGDDVDRELLAGPGLSSQAGVHVGLYDAPHGPLLGKKHVTVVQKLEGDVQQLGVQRERQRGTRWVS